LLLFGVGATFGRLSPSPPFDGANIGKISIFWFFLVAIGFGVSKIAEKK
jgi:hypothetical protein